MRDADFRPLDTTTWPSAALVGFTNGWGCFVLSTHEIVYCGVHTGGLSHHSSFLAGAPVLAAGMIKVENGRVKAIHEKNGHYQAKTEHMKTFLKLLVRRMPATDWSKVEYSEFGGFQTTVRDQLPAPSPPRPPRPAPRAPVVGRQLPGDVMQQFGAAVARRRI